MTRPWFRRAALGAAVALGSTTLLMASAGPAGAAVSNDTSAGAIAITSLPFSDAVDISTATTDAEDTQANASCGIDAIDRSIWYTYTPSTDTRVNIDVGQSDDFLPAVIVATGTPGDLTTVSCWTYSSMTVSLQAGTTYYVLAFADGPGGPPGAVLRISMAEVPPSPTVDVRVSSTGTVDTRTGVPTLHGTIACTNAYGADVYGPISQSVGRFTVTGWFDANASVTCDGTYQPWSGPAYVENGKFGGGKATASLFAYACGDVECAYWSADVTIQLSGSHR